MSKPASRPALLFRDDCGDSFRGFSVPEWRDAMRLVLAGEHVVHFAIERVEVATDENIRAQRDGYGTFCVLANRDAWNSEEGRLFLYSTGIGDDGGSAIL